MLSQHFRDRLDAVQEAAEEAASSFFYLPGIDEGLGLGSGRAPCAARPVEPPAPHVIRRGTVSAVRVLPAQISQWRSEGEALASQADDLVAFAAFADLEDAFEPLEALVIQVAADVEAHLQLQYDIARGK